MSTTFSCKDLGIRQSEFEAKTQFLYATLRPISLSGYGVCKLVTH